MALLEVCNLGKSFGSSEIIKDISFTLEEGEVLSIIGSSGCGKTTTLRCINFLEIPNQGKIIYKGEEIFNAEKKTKFSDKELRSKRLLFGMVFQSFNLFPQYTAYENIKLPLELMEKSKEKEGLPFLKKSEIEERSISLLSKVGLLEKKGYYPCELSGGQQQRVAIARAMALEPGVLCFDEPTSALDPELTGEVLKVIREVKENSNVTMIIVTHEMEFAKNISDKVIFMNKGVIWEKGNTKDIFENPQREETKQFLASYKNIG